MRYFLMILGLLLMSSTHAQSNKTKKADALQKGMYLKQAAEAYRKVLKKDPKDTYVLRQLANCHMNSGNYQEAAIWFQKCIDQGGSEPTDAYYYGQVLIAAGKIERGKHWMSKYFTAHPEDNRAATFVDFWSEDPTVERDDIALKPMEVNGEMSMMSPTYMDGELVVSINEDLGKDWEPAMRFSHGGDLFKISSKKNFDIRMATPLSGDVQTDAHEVCATMHPTTGMLYVTRVAQKGSKIKKDYLGNPLLEIAVFKKSGKTFTYSHLFKHSSNEYSTGYITFNPKGDIAYFSTNSSGTKGGFDIVQTTMT
ncbi:MAG: tetratricopeptide repeat protein, partial [Bacteroidota bacterium]